MSSVYWGIIASVLALVIALFSIIGICYRMPDESDHGESPAYSDEPQSSFPAGKHAA